VTIPCNGCVSLHDPGPAPQQRAGTCTLQDYHRFHLPVSGTIRCIRHVRGKLYTVNPIAVASTYANVFTQVLIDILPMLPSMQPACGSLWQCLGARQAAMKHKVDAFVCDICPCRTSGRW
jgi:Phosphatidylserine decarboxylase